MKTYCLFNEPYKILYRDYFKPSIQDDLEIFSKIIKENKYHNVTHQKLEYFTQAIIENLDSRILFLDVDIQFFEPILPTINKALDAFDICLLNGGITKEGNQWFNTGVMAVNCNKKIRKFFTGAIETFRLNLNKCKDFHDEEIINFGLKKYKNFLKIAMLSDQFWCGHRYWNGNGLVPNHPVICHHATGTDLSLEKKIQQLELFRNTIKPDSVKSKPISFM